MIPLTTAENGRRETDRLLPITAASAKSENNSDDEDKPSTGRTIIALAAPALGALLIDPLMTLVDTAFVGRYADTSDQLAGMGSAAALLTFSFYLFNFLCTATTPLVASRRASGNEQGALDVGGQALSLSLFMGFILTSVLIALSQPLLQVMGTSMTGEAANSYATSFLMVRAFAAPAVLCISASTGVLRGYLDTTTPIYILVFANLINLALDVLLIGQAGMGPMGAAIATTTAEWISAICFLLILAGKLPTADGQLGSNQERRDGSNAGGALVSVVPSLSVPAWEDVKPLLVASSSVLLRSFILQVSLSGAAAMAARGDDATASVAAHQIAIQLWLLCSFICDALAAASQGLVADALGRKSQEDARDVSMTVFVYSIILGLILSAGLWIGDSTNFVLDLFTKDPAVQTELSEILAIIILAQPLNSLVFAADGVLQGASEFPFQAKAMAISAFVALVYFIAIQGNAGGDTLVNVWLALIVLQSIRGVTSFYKLIQKDGPINLLAQLNILL
jgi:putative MATE family efflux protein